MSKLATAYSNLPIFIKNDVLVWNTKAYRVIDVDSVHVFLFELDKNKGFPSPYDSFELESHLLAGEISFLENHSYSVPSILLSNRDSAMAEAQSRFKLISPIIENESYLVSSVRGKLVNEQITRTGISKASIYRLLRLFWSHGQCLEALATRYERCGGKGKIRHLELSKPGPKNLNGKKQNAIRTSQHIAFMHRVIAVHFFAQKKPLTYAYRRFVTHCKESISNQDYDDIPSINSLKNILKKHYSVEQYARGTYDARVYKKDKRTLSGSATASVSGPGDRYEIDATLFEVHLVSIYDTSNVLGKPHVYIVIDVFSRLITGFYIGFHSPSFRIGSIALLSVVQDKTHLLKKYNIAPAICSTWPGTGLCSALLSDKAEFFGESGSHLAATTGIRMENTGSGRSDMKPFSERFLGMIQQPFAGNYPGKSNKVTNKKAGAIDGRLTATLTLPEFEEIVISEIILINNCRIMKGYDCEKDLPDELPRTPINIWNWGIANRSGKLAKVDEENLKLAVLPKDFATVSPSGVYFKKLFYFAEELEKLSWFIRIKNNRARPDKVEVHFDPMTVNQIYLILPDGCTKTVVCLLKPQSRQFKDCSFREVALRTSKQAATAFNTENYEEARRVTEEKALAIQKNAEKRKKQQTGKKPAAQTKRDIALNKELARKDERLKLIEDFSPQQFEVSLDEAEIEQLSTQDEFGNPELDELFNLNNDKEVDDETNGIDDE